MDNARLTVDGKVVDLPVVVGTENEVAIDIRALRKESGMITLDSGYGNTGSCESAITFIDGEKGILRHRGYSIEELAENSSFVEVAFLLIKGHLPTKAELDEYTRLLRYHSMLHEDFKKFFDGYPPSAHPMSVLSAMVSSLSAFWPTDDEPDTIEMNIVRLMAKIKTIAAYSYKKSIGQPFMYPRNDLSYVGDFLHMMFSIPTEEYRLSPVVEKTLEMLLILHADHEQNCSASTVRMVGSSAASLFASISAGIGALSGPLHGRANQEVIEMLEHIRDEGGNVQRYIDKAKDKNDPFRLMGFGHRVYKNYDPRARLIKDHVGHVLKDLGLKDPLLDIAKEVEERALHDPYFEERRLYPNVDYYSGIIYRALGIPTNMFTVMFSLGRLPGWIAQWKEMRADPGGRIHRPRQVYTGHSERPYVPLEERG